MPVEVSLFVERIVCALVQLDHPASGLLLPLVCGERLDNRFIRGALAGYVRGTDTCEVAAINPGVDKPLDLLDVATDRRAQGFAHAVHGEVVHELVALVFACRLRAEKRVVGLDAPSFDVFGLGADQHAVEHGTEALFEPRPLWEVLDQQEGRRAVDQAIHALDARRSIVDERLHHVGRDLPAIVDQMAIEAGDDERYERAAEAETYVDDFVVAVLLDQLQDRAADLPRRFTGVEAIGDVGNVQHVAVLEQHVLDGREVTLAVTCQDGRYGHDELLWVTPSCLEVGGNVLIHSNQPFSGSNEALN